MSILLWGLLSVTLITLVEIILLELSQQYKQYLN